VGTSSQGSPRGQDFAVARFNTDGSPDILNSRAITRSGVPEGNILRGGPEPSAVPPALGGGGALATLQDGQGRRAAVHVELREDPFEVLLDRVGAQEQFVGDLSIGHASS